MPSPLDDLRIRIFADGADPGTILALAEDPLISGFTTNPTLMRQAGVCDYETFARDLVERLEGRPISFEVFSDDPAEMERQALKIAAWGDRVYVKIPVTDTSGRSMAALVRRLTDQGVQVNVTALTTVEQVRTVAQAIEGGPPSFVSVFAGRIADTGRDPVPVIAASLDVLSAVPTASLIWASAREVLNVVQADAVGCDVITLTYDLLRKLPLLGRDLEEYSLATVRMFHDDAVAAGLSL